MTQSIAPWRGNGWSSAEPTTASPPPPDTDSLHTPPGEPLDLPVPLPPLPRAAVAGAAPTTQAARDAQVQAGLDAFRLAMTAPYRTPEGPVWVGTPFQMSRPYASQRAAVQANQAVLAQAATGARLTQDELALVQSARASPQSIHALTQALIDAGHLASGPGGLADAQSRVRKMMFDFGIGIDCAGYVQRAFLQATRTSASAAGFGPPLTEDLSNLARRGFNRIDDLTQVRPGDVVVLGPPAKHLGHRAIVYDQHLASDDDLAELRQSGGAASAFADTPPIRVFVVDSSWGSNGDPRYGGVRRESWWYSESTGRWGWSAPSDEAARPFSTADTPLAHPFTAPFGIYRAPAR